VSPVVPVVTAVLAVGLVSRAVVRLRRRGHRRDAPWSRVLLAVLAGGIGVAALTLLDEPADQLLSAHMLQHVLIGDLAPLLLLLAVRGPVLFHLLPVPALRGARALGLHRLLGAATRPSVAFALWAAGLGVWHVPALYDAALASERLHAFEHVTFVLGGVLVWSVLLDPANRGRVPGWRGFGYALGLLAATTALSNVLVLSYRPLYPAYDEPGPRAVDISPLRDQDLAALLMMLEQLATVGVFAALRARTLVRAQTGPPHAARHQLAA